MPETRTWAVMWRGRFAPTADAWRDSDRSPSQLVTTLAPSAANRLPRLLVRRPAGLTWSGISAGQYRQQRAGSGLVVLARHGETDASRARRRGLGGPRRAQPGQLRVRQSRAEVRRF